MEKKKEEICGERKRRDGKRGEGKGNDRDEGRGKHCRFISVIRFQGWGEVEKKKRFKN